MPWEIDYALLTFQQLKKSKYYIDKKFNITIFSALNLSSALIDWNLSKLPKEYFISKYKQLSALLLDYNHITNIYEGEDVWGHLNVQRDAIKTNSDAYISLCPDIYFSKYTLSYLLQAADNLTHEHYVITPQICKMWDKSWDVLVNKDFSNGPYYGWEKKFDIYDVDYFNSEATNITVTPINNSKWAGWFDLYSKDLYEKVIGFPEEWNGYGAWDFYGMVISEHLKINKIDFQQYVLENQVIFEYSIGNLRTNEVFGFSKYYKDLLITKDISEQRLVFDNNFSIFLKEALDKINKINKK